VSTRYVCNLIYELGVNRSHVAVHNWVQKAHLQPASTESADPLVIEEQVIRVDGDDHWLYGAVAPETTEIRQFRLFSVTMTDDAMVSGRDASTIPA